MSIWLRRWPILAGALAAGLLVLAVSYALPKEYAASTTVRVVETGGSEASVQSETVSYYAQTVAGLGETVPTLESVVARSGLPLTIDQVALQTDVAESSIPGFLTVTARAGDPADAARLADATVAALSQRVAADNAGANATSTAPLRQQIRQVVAQLAALPPGAPDRAVVQEQYTALVDAVTRLESGGAPQLLVGAPAVVPSIPESPTPRRNALLAFVVALIVLAEGVVVVRALRGRLNEHDPADEVTRLFGVRAVQVRSRDTAPAVLVPLLRELPPSENRLTVVQLGGPGDLDVGRRVQTSAALAWGGVTPDGWTGVPRIQTVRGARVGHSVLEGVRRAESPVVLAVDTARCGRRSLEEGLAALGAVGGRVLGVVVWRGRFPRDRAGVTAGAEATPPASTNGAGHVRRDAAPAAPPSRTSTNRHGTSESTVHGRS